MLELWGLFFKMVPTVDEKKASWWLLIQVDQFLLDSKTLVQFIRSLALQILFSETSELYTNIHLSMKLKQ